jgi:hypothetical protein
MSRENVEVVLGQWDAWNDGDLDRWAQAWDSDVVVFAPEGWPEGAVERPRCVEASGRTSAGYLGGGEGRG